MAKKEKPRQISIRLPEELVRLIDICRKRQGKHRTEYIREALIEKVEENLRTQENNK